LANLRQKWENIDLRPKAASTVFQNGDFISYDGLGGVIPAQSASLYGTATPILGVILQDVLSTDVDFASATPVYFQFAHAYKFICQVSAGTAVASMVGSQFDVDGVNPGQVDLSAPGTQLTVTRILSTTLVEVEVALVEQEG